MGYEVDFLPVTAGGAAVSVRWGAPGDYRILIYDGGTAVSGEQVVAHVRRQYMSSRVDYVVSSHPAADHAGGLAVVLRQLKVGELWMHRPWLQAAHLQRALPAARALEKIALSRKIPIHEPFAGAAIGPFIVLSPRRDWYTESLLPKFGRWPARANRLASATRDGLAALVGSSSGWTHRWAGDPLRREPVTTAENESSAVLYADFEGRGVMLTGRAGVQALAAAADHTEQLGFDLPSVLRLLQVPNEGSAGHVSSAVLDRIVGRPMQKPELSYTKSAFISVSLETQANPSRIVTDALKQRGTASFVTQGMSLHHGHEMPERGWYQARPAHLRLRD